MWSPAQFDALTVWADQLQAQGDGFGEALALGLTALRARLAGDPRAPALTEAEAQARARTEAGPLAAWIEGAASRRGGRPSLSAVWCGPLLVALRYDAESRYVKIEDLIRRALTSRCAAHMRLLHIQPPLGAGASRLRQIGAALREADVVARPKVLILGPAPCDNAVHHRTAHGVDRCPWPEPEDGLWACFWGHEALALPYHSGTRKERQAFLEQQARAAMLRARSGGQVSPAVLTALARGLFDPSWRIHRRSARLAAQVGPQAAGLLPLVALPRAAALTPGPEARRAAADFLASAVYDGSVPAIAEALRGYVDSSVLVHGVGSYGRPQWLRTSLPLPLALAGRTEWGPVIEVLIEAAKAGGYDQKVLDLNAACHSELSALPGVGWVIANRILSRRQEWPFLSVDGLADVEGISAQTVEALRRHCQVQRPKSLLDPRTVDARALPVPRAVAEAVAAAAPFWVPKDLLEVPGVGPVRYGLLAPMFDWELVCGRHE